MGFKVPPATLLLLKRMGELLQSGIEQVALLRASGVEINADLIGIWLEQQMGDWDPSIKGKHLLDAPTKRAAARFLAGVACNLSVKSGASDECAA
jgi:hypothetical protein